MKLRNVECTYYINRFGGTGCPTHEKGACLERDTRDSNKSSGIYFN